MDLTQLIGIGASICTGLYLLPQLIKLKKEKQSENISLPMLGVLFAGLALWVIYGSLKQDWIIIISNCISLLLNSWIGVLSFRYKKEKPM
jgi:MtN3 and saliva related transmembrane protein